MVKNPPATWRRPGFNTWVGKNLWKGTGYPLQCFCLVNSMARGAISSQRLGHNWATNSLYFQTQLEYRKNHLGVKMQIPRPFPPKRQIDQRVWAQESVLLESSPGDDRGNKLALSKKHLSTTNWHLPSPSTRIKSCAAADADFQHLWKEYRVESRNETLYSGKN